MATTEADPLQDNRSDQPDPELKEFWLREWQGFNQDQARLYHEHHVLPREEYLESAMHVMGRIVVHHERLLETAYAKIGELTLRINGLEAQHPPKRPRGRPRKQAIITEGDDHE